MMTSVTQDEKALRDLLKGAPARAFVAKDAPAPHCDIEQTLLLASLDVAERTAETQALWEHALSCRGCFLEIAEAREALQRAESAEALSFVTVWAPFPSRAKTFQLRLDIWADKAKRVLEFPSLSSMLEASRLQYQASRTRYAYRGDDAPVAQTVDIPLPEVGGALQVTASLIDARLSVRITPRFPDKRAGERIGDFWVWRKSGEREDVNLLGKALNEAGFEPTDLISSDVVQFVCEGCTYRIELGFLSGD